MKASTREFLSGTELFGSVDAAALDEVARELETVRLAGGERLFRQGEDADCLYVVVSGRLRAFVAREGGVEKPVGEAARGEVVGEIALLVQGPRTATMRAIRDTELLRLSRGTFDALVEKHPRLMVPLARRIVLRDQEAMRGARRFEAPATIAVVPAGAGVALGEFADKLEKALSAAGKTLRLDAKRLDESLGAGASRTPRHGADRDRVVDWLNKQEAEHDFLLYATDLGPSEWTDFCLRQADRVLVVVPGDRVPEPGEGEKLNALLSDTHGREEMILLHAERKRLYLDAARWTALRPPSRRHHVALSLTGDFERLVRGLTGAALGLVLGGGGARGFAHIGVLRALEEAGVEPDQIGGTSMGSFVSAQYALGMDWREMRDFNARFWNTLKPFSDVTLPMLALSRGKRYERVARELFGDARIEDLWIDYFCVVSSLTRAEISVPAEGPLQRWVGASMAVPGIIPPLFDNGELFVDGGVLDNVPVDVMRARCDGPIIAVDVTPRVDLATDPRWESSPSPWDVLWSRMSPTAERIEAPVLPSILARTTALGCVRMVETMKRDAALYLHPPIEGYGMLDFKRIDPIIEVGYEYARARVAEWLASKPGQKTASP